MMMYCLEHACTVYIVVHHERIKIVNVNRYCTINVMQFCTLLAVTTSEKDENLFTPTLVVQFHADYCPEGSLPSMVHP